MVKKKENPKSQKQISKNKFDLELLHQILEHSYKHTLLAGYTTMFWHDIDLRIYPVPFCTSCHISTINKKFCIKDTYEAQYTFQIGVYGHHTRNNFQTFNKKTAYANYLSILDAYSSISGLYGIENSTTEEVMDKLYMFQAIFGKVDEFGWWDMERVQTGAGIQFTTKEFQ